MPNSVPLMKCHFCQNSLRANEVFSCYSCLHEHCPKIRNLAYKQMMLEDDKLSESFWKPPAVRRCIPKNLSDNSPHFHSIHSKTNYKRHAWNV